MFSPPSPSVLVFGLFIVAVSGLRLRQVFLLLMFLQLQFELLISRQLCWSCLFTQTDNSHFGVTTVFYAVSYY